MHSDCHNVDHVISLDGFLKHVQVFSLLFYVHSLQQVVVMALVAATLFLRTHIHPVSPNDGQEIAGFCFFATLVMLFNGIAELSMSVSCILT